ncbi:hypothetical protein GJ496_003116 [Pomphorhynchus laevis]|nr:hypothetical protein GJ496_003116 [Pomphorhynchus laevis]
MANKSDKSFKNKNASTILPRAFLTEQEIDKARQERQMEWERVRNATDPIEAPPEMFDCRPLYERLREQQEKKRISFEEQYAQRNTIKGLDEDEFHFLSDIDKMKAENDKRIKNEENKLLEEFRQQRKKQFPDQPESKLDPFDLVSSTQHAPEGTASICRTSNQLKLLTSAVKRKLPSSNTKNSSTDLETSCKKATLSRCRPLSGIQRISAIKKCLPGFESSPSITTSTSDSNSSDDGEKKSSTRWQRPSSVNTKTKKTDNKKCKHESSSDSQTSGESDN